MLSREVRRGHGCIASEHVDSNVVDGMSRQAGNAKVLASFLSQDMPRSGGGAETVRVLPAWPSSARRCAAVSRRWLNLTQCMCPSAQASAPPMPPQPQQPSFEITVMDPVKQGEGMGVRWPHEHAIPMWAYHAGKSPCDGDALRRLGLEVSRRTGSCAGIRVVPGAHAHDCAAVRRPRAGGHPSLQRLRYAARAAASQVQRSGLVQQPVPAGRSCRLRMAVQGRAGGRLRKAARLQWL